MAWRVARIQLASRPEGRETVCPQPFQVPRNVVAMGWRAVFAGARTLRGGKDFSASRRGSAVCERGSLICAKRHRPRPNKLLSQPPCAGTSTRALSPIGGGVRSPQRLAPPRPSVCWRPRLRSRQFWALLPQRQLRRSLAMLGLLTRRQAKPQAADDSSGQQSSADNGSDVRSMGQVSATVPDSMGPHMQPAMESSASLSLAAAYVSEGGAGRVSGWLR